MNSPETLNTKLAFNELNFPLVTHLINSDARFEGYGLLKLGQGTEQILDRLGIHANDQVLGHAKHESCWGVNIDSEGHLFRFSTPTHTHVSDVHSHGYGHFGTATCGVSDLLKNRINKRVETFDTVTGSGKIMTFKLVIMLR
jgi:hypothetical protein